MNRRIITIVGLVILSALLIVFFIKQNQNNRSTVNTEYVNDQYSFVNMGKVNI